MTKAQSHWHVLLLTCHKEDKTAGMTPATLKTRHLKAQKTQRLM